MEKKICLNKEFFKAVHTAIENVSFDGDQVLRVVKNDKLMEFDTNSYAKVETIDFHNGTIEVKMLSRLLMDAPEFARGFIGIAFRINDDDSTFESFYLRPTNGRSCEDPIRQRRGGQYFSYPTYTFEFFRDRNITDYETKADIDLNEWIDLKAVIEDETATFYVNGEKSMVVNNLKHGRESKGKIGLFVDIGTEAFFKDLNVILAD